MVRCSLGGTPLGVSCIRGARILAKAPAADHRAGYSLPGPAGRAPAVAERRKVQEALHIARAGKAAPHRAAAAGVRSRRVGAPQAEAAALRLALEAGGPQGAVEAGAQHERIP